MVNITLAMPEDLKKEMDKFPEINWSALVREAIKQIVPDLFNETKIDVSCVSEKLKELLKQESKREMK